jgi:hypothetical protein
MRLNMWLNIVDKLYRENYWLSPLFAYHAASGLPRECLSKSPFLPCAACLPLATFNLPGPMCPREGSCNRPKQSWVTSIHSSFERIQIGHRMIILVTIAMPPWLHSGGLAPPRRRILLHCHSSAQARLLASIGAIRLAHAASRPNFALSPLWPGQPAI